MPPDTAEHRLTSAMRLLLATTALVLTAAAPPQIGPPLAATYTVLGLYFVHAAVVHAMARVTKTVSTRFQYSLPWIDLGATGLLVTLNGWQSLYFLLFFFGIIVASLRWGMISGIVATALSIGLFATGGALGPGAAALDEPAFVIRLMSLGVLGYMIALRGEYELRSRRRLALLRDIGTLSNPRFGANRMLARALESLRAFFDADVCLAVLRAHDARGHELRRATRSRPDAGGEAEEMPAALTAALLAPVH
jgi:hypothetical protein